MRDTDVQSYFYFESSNTDESSQRIYIYGYLLPQSTPYKYGSYKVCITLPGDFPFKPPDMELLTHIYHPAMNNYDSTTNYCKGCCRKQWSPAISISKTIENFVYAIDHPEDAGAYCVMDQSAKQLYDENRSEYEEKALAMVMKYSCPRPNPSIISLKLASKRLICKQLYFESAKINQLLLSSSLKQYLNASSNEI